MPRDLAPLSAPPETSLLARAEALARADLLAAWLEGRKPTTVKEYKKDMGHFARALDPNHPTEALNRFLHSTPAEAHHVALTYRNTLLQRGLATATIARRIASVRSFVDFAHSIGRCAYLLRLDAYRVEPRRDARGPFGSDLKKVIAAAAALGPSPRGRRDRAIFALLFGLGLRRGEVTTIDIDDFDAEKRTLHVLGKGRREKLSLHVPAPIAEALEAWLFARGPDPGPLFLRTDHPSPEPLSGDAIERLVARIGEKAGLARKLTPHMLRHSAITLLRRGGKTTRQAAAFSRHAKEQMVEAYDDAKGEDHRAMAEIVAAAL